MGCGLPTSHVAQPDSCAAVETIRVHEHAETFVEQAAAFGVQCVDPSLLVELEILHCGAEGEP
jgi:hypothetical protein